jgi:hypothetical protein
MIDQRASSRQLDLLVRAANTLDPRRIPPRLRAEVASLLKLLLAEHIGAGVALPREAADE